MAPTSGTSSPRVHVRRLTERDDRAAFSSGNEDLDRFFRRYAGQNQFQHHLGTTYIAVDESTGTVLGFATVASSSVLRDALPAPRRKRLPHYPLPVLRLARLAVDGRARGQGIGKLLLRAVFGLAHQQASGFGCIGVVVDAKGDAIAFYSQYGFEPLEAEAGALELHPEPTPMFLELGAIPREQP